MPSVILYCTRCRVGYGSLGEIPAVCPACQQPTTWTTIAPMVAPAWSLYDRRFLRRLRIAADAGADRSGATRE